MLKKSLYIFMTTILVLFISTMLMACGKSDPSKNNGGGGDGNNNTDNSWEISFNIVNFNYGDGFENQQPTTSISYTMGTRKYNSLDEALYMEYPYTTWQDNGITIISSPSTWYLDMGCTEEFDIFNCDYLSKPKKWNLYASNEMWTEPYFINETGSVFVSGMPYGKVVIPSSVKFGNQDIIVNNLNIVLTEKDDKPRLTKLVLPNTLETYGDEWGEDIKVIDSRHGKLTVEIDGTCNNFEVIDNCLMYKPTKTLLYSDHRNLIPADTQEIANGVFDSRNNITNLNIPSSLHTIGINAFRQTSISSITIPNSLKTINNEAFSGCHNLTSLSFESNSTLENIGQFAFGSTNIGKGSEQYEIIVPRSVKHIGDLAFGSYDEIHSPRFTSIVFEDGSLLEDVGHNVFGYQEELDTLIIPNLEEIQLDRYLESRSKVNKVIVRGGTKIGEEAFCDFSNILAVELPNTITSIENGAFKNCSSITSMVIPDSVSSIGLKTLEGMTGLTNITTPILGTTNADCEAKGLISFFTDTHFFYYYYSSYPVSLKTISLTKGSSLPDYAFYNMTFISNITIPSTITSIGSYAFDGCKALRSFDFSNITTLADYALMNCHITTISFPKLVSIGREAFKNSSIMSVNFSDNLKTIGDEAFENSYLTTINIEPTANLTRIGNYAFKNCNNLQQIIIPKADSIGTDILNGIGTKLQYLKIDQDDKLDTLLDSTLSYTDLTEIVIFDDYLIKDNSFNRSYIPNITTVTICEGVVELGNNVFSSKITTLSLPSTLNKIGDNTFKDCHIAININFNNCNLTHIGDYALYNYTGNANLTLNNVSYIGDYALYGCTVIDSISINDTMSNIGENALALSNITDIAVHSDNEYFKTKGSDLVVGNRIVLGGNNTTLNNITHIDDYAFRNATSVGDIVLNNAMSRIGHFAFTNSGVTSVTINNIVDFIGECAFSDNTTLKRLYIDKDCAPGAIDKHILKNTGLETLSIPSIINIYKDPAPITYLTESPLSTLTTVSLTNQLIIADNFAKGFINLSTINILDEITSLGKYAFSATAITSFTLPKNITTLPDYCLNNCIQLKTLTLNDVCQHIGNYAVGNCGSLKEIVWNDIVSSIGNNSFEYCTSLKRAILPNSMIHLGSEVFRNCYSLEIVYFGENMSSIVNGASSTVPDGFISPFKNCNKDKLSVYIHADNTYKYGYWWDVVDTSAAGTANVVENCLISEDGKYILHSRYGDNEYDTLVRFLGNDSSLIVSSEIKQIESNAFSGMDVLLTEVIINHEVIIRNNIFNLCLYLKKIYIGKSVTVYEKAFINCGSAQIITEKENGLLDNLIKYDNGTDIQKFTNIIYNTSYEEYLAM